MAMRTDPNHPTRRAVLDYIIQYKRENDGCAPSLREIGAATNLATPSAVEHQLDTLETLGYIARKVGQPRCIAVVGGEWRMG